jgi:DNA-binding transcriptional LysR family regulator
MNENNLLRADLNLLQLFEVVLEERHVGRAAKRLNLTSSAVSHGLNRLRRLLNDPLFLKMPKGVVPSERALTLAEPIADVLARARRVVATAQPFDPGATARRFTIGMPDSMAAIFMAPLLAEVRRLAPRIDVNVRQLLHEQAVAELDARTVDIAIVLARDIPKRFVDHVLLEGDFMIATRARHPFVRDPSLDRFCEMPHVVISPTGDAHTFIDDTLAAMGRVRRVAATVPNFMLACALVAETDLITTLSRAFLARHGKRFGVVGTRSPVPMRRFQARAVMPKAALTDAGLEWLFELLKNSLGGVRET